MLLGKVIGTVVATRKDERLEGVKFLIVRNVGLKADMVDGFAVAVDAVGAGIGEMVLYATGSAARQTALTKDRPVDAIIMAIVDSWDLEGKIIFQKE